jgi:large subunit ribosomal protein L23
MGKLKILDIIKYPIVTSKASMLNSNNNHPKLVIKVCMNANKIEIKEIVESSFSTKVESVNVIVVKGKQKKYARRYKYKTNDYKKAIITLKEGVDFNNSSSININTSEERGFIEGQIEDNKI